MYRQFRAAIQILEPALAHRPHFKIYQLASWTLGQDGRPESQQRALQLASMMVQMEPDNPIGYYNLGYVNYWMNRPMEALMAFEKLLTLWPDPPEVGQIVEQLRKQVRQTSWLWGFANYSYQDTRQSMTGQSQRGGPFSTAMRGFARSSTTG